MGLNLKSVLQAIPVVLLVAALIWGAKVMDVFRLDANDTVYDYYTMSHNRKKHFLNNICNGGKCLTSRDWACGFTNGDPNEFRDCFYAVVDSVKPWVRLDAVRKLCGNRTMKFIGEVYSKPDDCAEAGGRWGVRGAPPHIDFY